MPIDVVNVGKNAMDVRKSVALTPYSKVIINVAKGNNSDEVISYVAGDDSGTTLEFDCPWGTQKMANDLLAKVNGYQYQPYEATGAITNPAVEMGDAVQVNGVYGGIYQQDAQFTHTFYSDFSAPQDEQLDHEFTYESPVERRLTRQEAYSRSTFKIQHDNIEAKVSQKSGDIESGSFSWRLLYNEFGLYSGTKKVFTCNKDGIDVDGTIKARSGYIGTDANGFNIADRAIWNGKDAIGATSASQQDGVYVGTNGIALGKINIGTSESPNYADAFSVTNNGTFTARKGYIGNGSSGFNISNSAIYNGTSSASSDAQGVYIGTRAIRSYYDATKSFTFNATNGTLTICAGMKNLDDTNNGAFIGNTGIALGGGNFKVTSGGALTAKSATITGTVTAKTGRIGADENGANGFYLTANKFYSDGKTSYSSETDGVYIGTDGIGLGQKKFYVTKEGKLTATDVSVEGYVKATSGEFAGELKAATGTFKGELSAATGTFKGELSAATGTFKGELSAATGSFTGSVTATSGRIGSDNSAWNIGANNIYNGTSKISGEGSEVKGVYLGIDGIRIWQDDKTSFTFTKSGDLSIMKGMKAVDDEANTSGLFIGNEGIALGGGKFKVTKGGILTAKEGNFTGTITATNSDFTGKVTATSGRIGSANSAWSIGSDNIYNGTNSLTSTTKGAYVGVDGIRIYNSDTQKFTFKKVGSESTKASIEICCGMNGFDDVKGDYDGWTGLYFGNDGISIGCGQFRAGKNGQVRMTKARIGDTWSDSAKAWLEDGFEIENKHISKGMTSLSDTTHNGVFISVDGIALGKGNFKVTDAGKLTANSADIHGKIQCESITFDNNVTIDGSVIASGIKAANITDGQIADGQISGVGGEKVGSGIKGGNINGTSIPKGTLTTGTQNEIDKGVNADDVLDDVVHGRVTCDALKSKDVNTRTLAVAGSATGTIYDVSFKSVTDTSGNTVHVLGY